MYGKIFAHMFRGSMYGIGPVPIAVWAYVIANMDEQGTLELNPVELKDILGADQGEIEAAIREFKRPDPKSRCKKEDGRRLVQQGEYLYWVPSHESYQRIWKDEARRAYLRERQREYRERQRLEAGDDGDRPPDVDEDGVIAGPTGDKAPEPSPPVGKSKPKPKLPEGKW